MMNRRLSISFGTLFSIIVVYFIFLYTKNQQGIGWTILKYIAGAYLVLSVGFILLAILVFLIISLVLLSFFLYAKFSHDKHKKKKIFEPKFKVKEKKKPDFELQRPYNSPNYFLMAFLAFKNTVRSFCNHSLLNLKQRAATSLTNHIHSMT